MKAKKVKALLIVLLTFIFSGCASNAFIQEVTPLNSSLSSCDRVKVTVTAKSQSVKEKKGYEVSKRALEEEFISSLSKTNKFKIVSRRISDNPGKGTIIINLIIEHLSYLSGASSVMGGVLSGNSHVKVLAQIIDAETGETIGEIRSGANTELSGGIFRGSTGTLISKISNKLASEIASYK